MRKRRAIFTPLGYQVAKREEFKAAASTLKKLYPHDPHEPREEIERVLQALVMAKPTRSRYELVEKAIDVFETSPTSTSRHSTKLRSRGPSGGRGSSTDLFVEGVGHRLPHGYEIHWNWIARRDGKKVDSGALTGGDLPEFYETWPDIRGVKAIVDQVKKILREEWIPSGEFGALNSSPKVSVSLRKSSSEVPIRGR